MTLEVLQEAVAAVYADTEPHPCRLGKHVVSPEGLARLQAGGWTRCAVCGGPVGPFSV